MSSILGEIDLVEASESNKSVKFSVSIPEKLNVILEKHVLESKSDKSPIIAKAIAEYLQRTEEDEVVRLKATAAAEHLYDCRHLFGEQQAWVESRLDTLDANVRYISHVLETLFRVRRNPIQPDLPTSEDFKGMLSEAVGAYIKDETLLTPVIKGWSELERAAGMQAYDNAFKEAEDLLKSMPFMSEPRFYVGLTMGGPAVYDREFKATGPGAAYSVTGDFPVASIRVDHGEMTVTYPATRPHFELNSADQREHAWASGPQAVAQIVPVIVADYLAFRQRNGSIPKNPFYHKREEAE
ncbi:hypothetical protein [Neorhizobium alkalisoli]|uniref:hypothetical protein n=1 Tax=Neorhizobium alkalisoli TaxID=528178 RepID=UPI000CF892ED|nr:hypothetical protein [Neorhizobium alkalisoli]